MQTSRRALRAAQVGLLVLIAVALRGADTPAAPVWLDASGRPGAQARMALQQLAAAGEEGLSPADYDAAALAAEADRLAAEPAPQPEQGAAFDARLTTATARFLRHLHQGRIDPRLLSFRMAPPADPPDYAAIAREAAAGHRIAETVADLRPRLALYGDLRLALARYRALAASEDAEPLPTWPAALQPKQKAHGLGALRRRLVALGDLPATASTGKEPTTLDAALVGGLERYQERHGLAADGALGQATQYALRVPLAERARQIELAMERLRWLPPLDPQRLLMVDIPMFRLFAWGPEPRPRPDLTSDVIVGHALDHGTPVMVQRLGQVIFRPTWNVPASIVENEVVAGVTRDASYLSRHGMEIVAGGADDARAVAPSAATIAGLRAGRYRVRQPAGGGNPLGLVKFVFPSELDVYLHDTPERNLFRKARRDLSHGCVRVAEPVALAQWVLAGQPGWDKAHVLAAMHGSRTQRVAVARPVQVILFYVTALVTDDGAVHFADDIYGHDARLELALQSRRG